MREPSLAAAGAPAAEADPVLLEDPVGETVRTARGRWGLATATFDQHGKYRFRLSRIWGPKTDGRVCWVMLNPSTATEEETDPTVERTLRYARAWGYGASEVVNVFALRATDPKLLKQADDPVGPGNDRAIAAAAQAADLVVVAWGVHAVLQGRGQRVAELLEEAGVEPQCLHITKTGHPGHPLYLPSTAQLRPWRGGSA